MRHPSRRLTGLLTVLLLLLATACDLVARPAQLEVNEERKQELAQELANDMVTHLLPNRDAPFLLVEQDVVVSATGSNEITYNMERLADFAGEYAAGGDCSLTVVFTNQAYVIVRIVFVQGEGYYFRYQYDPREAGGPYSIACQPIDGVTVEPHIDRNKVELTLHSGGSDIATFVLRNPAQLSGPGGE